MDILVSTRRPTNINKLDVNDLQRIINLSFIKLDMFALVIPYCFSVQLILNNDDFLGQNIAEMMTLMHIRMYKRHDIS